MAEADMQWENVATAPDQMTAEMWQGLLEAEGIPSMISPKDTMSFMGISAMPCDVLVPADAVEKARMILQDYVDKSDLK